MDDSSDKPTQGSRHSSQDCCSPWIHSSKKEYCSGGSSKGIGAVHRKVCKIHDFIGDIDSEYKNCKKQTLFQNTDENTHYFSPATFATDRISSGMIMPKDSAAFLFTTMMGFFMVEMGSSLGSFPFRISMAMSPVSLPSS